MKGLHVVLIAVSMAGTAVSLSCTLEEQPGEMAVVVGSSLALNCSLICEGLQVGMSCLEKRMSCWQIQMSWHFCGSESATCKDVAKRDTFQSSDERHWLNYDIENPTHEHKGRYFCNVTVDRPIYWYMSSGTKVNVTERPAPGLPGWFRSEAFMVSAAAAGLLVLLLVALFVILCVVQRRRRRPKVKSFAVYGNTRPQPPATRKQETSKPRTQEATRGHQKSASCRTAPLCKA